MASGKKKALATANAKLDSTCRQGKLQAAPCIVYLHRLAMEPASCTSAATKRDLTNDPEPREPTANKEGLVARPESMLSPKGEALEV